MLEDLYKTSLSIERLVITLCAERKTLDSRASESGLSAAPAGRHWLPSCGILGVMLVVP